MVTDVSSVSLKPSDRLNTAQAAAFLGLSPNTLTCWRSRKQGPRYYRFGGKLVSYEVSDLQAFLLTKRVEFEQVPI